MKKNFLFVIFCLLFITGCNVYNAKIYSQINDYVKSEVFDNDLTYEHYVDGGYIMIHYFHEDDIIYLIKTEEEYKKVFNDFPDEIDFEKEMLCVVVYMDCTSYDYNIRNIKINDNQLTITIRDERPIKLLPYGGSSPIPFQRVIAVKMEKKDITNVKFIFK